MFKQKIMNSKLYALLLLLVFFGRSNSSGQTWAPKGMQWTYLFEAVSWDYSHQEAVHYEASDTTTRLGHLCTIIRRLGAPLDTLSFNPLTSSLITYEDEGVVYMFSPITKQFTVLYDFNKKAGESWTVYGIQKSPNSEDEWTRMDTLKCPVTVHVDSVKVITINGHDLRKLFVSSFADSYYSTQFNGTIIEGIGHTKRPFPLNTCLYECIEGSDCFSHLKELRCIDNGELGFYDFKKATYCDYTFVSMDKVHQVNITPNPSQGVFNVQYLPEGKGVITVLVYDVLGRTIYKEALQSSSETIRLEAPDGLYILELANETGLQQRQKVEIRH